MEIEQIKVGFMDVFCYLVSCSKTKEAMVIDPGGDEEKIVKKIAEKGLTLKYIVNTHGHVDHSCGNEKVKELTGAKIIMHKEDDNIFNYPKGQNRALEWGFALSPPADMHIKDGDIINAGKISLSVIHTPGHSPGGICLLGNGNLFTGDTLFVGAIGRTDFPESSYSQIMESIKERLLTLPGETIVWPGHDYGDRFCSTIEEEKRSNPFL